MRLLPWCVLVTALAVCSAAPLRAQQRPTADPPQADRPQTAPVTPPSPRTGKERLGGKWTDEQRLDNCKVPPDKRGPKPRPDACAATPLL
ncbi:MAG TPA: hypothetical protein VJR58_12005 [Vineibacter sp.]|nr:hypothetical protein [Vineibacter sp.]